MLTMKTIETLTKYFREYWNDTATVRESMTREGLYVVELKNSFNPSDFEAMDNDLKIECGGEVVEVMAADFGVILLTIDTDTMNDDE